MSIASQHNLYVVEDVAHAPGAACWMPDDTAYASQASGRRVLKTCGSIGDIGCFSFFANKNMTTGEGGMLTTNSDALAGKIQLLRSHGMTSLTWDRDQGHGFSYDVIELGYNYRIDEIRSAIGITQIQKIDINNQKRSNITNIYREELDQIDNISLPFIKNPNISSYHLFTILLNENIERKSFMQFMKNKGVQTSIHYPPVHKFAHYKFLRNDNLSNTDKIGEQVVTLPLYPSISRDKIRYVIESIKEWAGA
jgi:dTDP-4-amino-4,6-dideoxygalactose transaminase